MRGSAGFTLIEVMLSLFIIALLSGLAVLVLPSGEPDIETLSETVITDLRRASRHSIISGRAVAWDIRDGHFSDYWRGRWRRLADFGDRSKYPYRIEPVHGFRGNHVIFSPTGEVSPGRLKLVSGLASRLVVIEAGGRIHAEPEPFQ